MFRSIPKHLADEYTIDCKGDCCVGDEVLFQESVYEGVYPNAKFSHFTFVTGKIVKDSYGKQKQQHTFTLDTKTGRKLIKGRNLYRHMTLRKPWPDEEKRKAVLKEKHQRGNEARAVRNKRRPDYILGRSR